MIKIGVLALQGDFSEHVKRLQDIGADAFEVRTAREIESSDGLIIPGGESTTIGKLIERFELAPTLQAFADSGRPVWGTCAGLILMARDVDDASRGRHQPLLGLLDVTVRRNAFGSQLDSFETELDFYGLAGGPLPAVFIRAPVITKTGDDVEVLARLDGGEIVAVRQRNLLGTAFHPELTFDARLHEWFASLAVRSRSSAAV